MRERLGRLDGILRASNLDALLLEDEVTRFYATGVRSSAGLVLLTPEQRFFCTDFRYIEAAQICRDAFAVVETGAQNPESQWLRARLRGGMRVGYQAMRMTAAKFAHRKKEFPRVKWVSADAEILGLRAVKDRDEIAAMRRAQAIAESAYGEVLALLREGIAEREVAAELTYRMLRHGADGMSFPPIVASGENGSKPHAAPSGKPLRRGEFVTMDFGCVKDGYCSDMTRTVAVGTPSGEMREIYGIVLRAQETGIAAARAGVKGREIDAAARAVIAAAGYGAHFGHGFGHGLGLEVHEQPGANATEERVLPAGTVISAEPGIYLPGRFGVRIEDVLLLNETGCENLTGARKALLSV